MNNGINPMHGALAMPALQDEPGSPVHQAPIAPVMPNAPVRKSYAVRREALRDRIAQRGPRDDIPTTPRASLSQGVKLEGALFELPREVAAKIVSHLAGPAEVKSFRRASKASRLLSLEEIQHFVLQDPADLDGMIKRYPNAEKITLVGDVFSSRVLEKIKQEMPNIKHIVVRHEQPRRDEALAAVEHLPKQGPLDHDVATLAQSRPPERNVERARTLADLAALFPEPVGHPKHVQIEVPVPPVPALPTRRILDF